MKFIRSEAAWGDAKMVCIIDALIGLSWLLGNSSRTVGAAYVPARRVFEWAPVYPMRLWGAILVGLALTKATSVFFRHGALMELMLYFGACFWLWFALLWLDAAIGGSSFVGMFFAFGWAYRHYKIIAAQPWEMER